MSLTTVIIPARYESSRFPAKVLADRTGKPLIQHVYERASQAEMVNDVIVAADDQRIIDAVNDFGGQAVLTSTDHPNSFCQTQICHTLFLIVGSSQCPPETLRSVSLLSTQIVIHPDAAA